MSECAREPPGRAEGALGGEKAGTHPGEGTFPLSPWLLAPVDV